jgi:hypothetical protein
MSNSLFYLSYFVTHIRSNFRDIRSEFWLSAADAQRQMDDQFWKNSLVVMSLQKLLHLERSAEVGLRGRGFMPCCGCTKMASTRKIAGMGNPSKYEMGGGEASQRRSNECDGKIGMFFERLMEKEAAYWQMMDHSDPNEVKIDTT